MKLLQEYLHLARHGQGRDIAAARVMYRFRFVMQCPGKEISDTGQDVDECQGGHVVDLNLPPPAPPVYIHSSRIDRIQDRDERDGSLGASQDDAQVPRLAASVRKALTTLFTACDIQVRLAASSACLCSCLLIRSSMLVQLTKLPIT